jgi:hypothetical protein
MAMIDRNFTFATNGTVTANDLHNLIDSATIYQDLITGQLPITSVGTNYELLIADGTNPNAAPNAVTVYDLFEDALTAGTYTNANISAALTYGTATGTRLVSANATITTGTITTGVIPTLTSSTATFGTTTSTAATITSGTITNLASTSGTIATLNSTTGTIATLNSTTGTIATLNSTTGTITNLSTTLTGDFTISNGTGTLGTSGATAGTYGSVSAIPFITVDAKGRITSATTGTFSTTPADGSITPAKLSQPFTLATAVASTSGTAIDFTSIPSWVKRVTVVFNGVSISGTSNYLLQIGSGSVLTTGYDSAASSFNNVNTGSTIGFILTAGNLVVASTLSGAVVLAGINPSTNTWVSSGNVSNTVNPSTNGASHLSGGNRALSGALDRVRLTTVNGTDTFDAGSVNIMYEG